MILLKNNKINKVIRNLKRPIATISLTTGIAVSFFSYNTFKEYNKNINRKSISFNEPIDAHSGNIKLKKTNMELNIDLNSTSKINFLKYFQNIDTLNISVREKEDWCERIPFHPTVRKIIINYPNGKYGEEDNLIIMKKFPNLEELSFESTNTFFEPNSIENSKVKKISINNERNCNINFSKLDFLEELEIKSDKPYNIAIWLNTTEYNTLKNSGVKLTFQPNVEKEYKKISDRMDKIIEKINTSSSNTDKEKLNSILTYILENLEYDSETVEKIRTMDNKNEIIGNYYKGGQLYAALEEPKQICGNYASMIKALYDRIDSPQNCYIVSGSNHAWNIVMIDNIPYYVDASYLDTHYVGLLNESNTAVDFIKNNDTENLLWYKNKVDFYNSTKYSGHIPDYIPEYYRKKY